MAVSAQRPHCVERTGSLSTPEAKRYKARLVLRVGGGAAREVLKALSSLHSIPRAQRREVEPDQPLGGRCGVWDGLGEGGGIQKLSRRRFPLSRGSGNA